MMRSIKPHAIGAVALALSLVAGCNSGGDSAEQDISRCLATPDYNLSRFHHAAKCVKLQSANRDTCASKAAITACLCRHKDYDAKATTRYVEHLAAKGLISLK